MENLKLLLNYYENGSKYVGVNTCLCVYVRIYYIGRHKVMVSNMVTVTVTLTVVAARLGRVAAPGRA